MNFLDFIEQKRQTTNDLAVLNEAFDNNKIENVLELIENVLRNHLDDKLMPLKDFVNVTIDGEQYKIKEYVVTSKNHRSMMFTLNWKVSEKSSEIFSVSFFKDLVFLFAQEGEPVATINTHGISIVKILPLIWEAINNNDYTFSDEFVKTKTKILNDEYEANESKFNAYYERYSILEGIPNDTIVKMFRQVNEDDEAKQMLKAKREELDKAKQSGEKDLIAKIFGEYSKLTDAVYKDGAKTEEEVQVSIERRQKFKEMPSPSVKTAEEQERKSGRKDPEQVFKEMSKYIELVIKGIQTSVIICGAPGVGKTYRVRQQLKAAGYKEGVNMYTYKGKGTPRALFLTLYNFKKKGDIVVIDDADALVGPKAPEDSINILKAALDSTSDEEGRLVNYGIGTKLVDDDGNQVEKKFYYNGGIIVITNYNAGQLDSALRGRSFIQDISFSIEETLGIIKKLMPDIEPELYSRESKMKAYAFLEELSKDEKYKMNISVRIFCLCSKLFESCAHDDNFDDEDVKSMIKEQMKNQSADGGKKY